MTRSAHAHARPLPPGPEGVSRPGRWTVEATFTYLGGVYELRLGRVPGLRGKAWQADSEFALIGDDPVLIAARFGAGAWIAAEYREPPDGGARDDLPAPSGAREHRALFNVLASGKGGAWTSAGNVTLSLDFTRALDAAIRDRRRPPLDPASRSRAFLRLADRNPSLASLVARSGVRSRGSP